MDEQRRKQSKILECLISERPATKLKQNNLKIERIRRRIAATALERLKISSNATTREIKINK